MTPTLRQVVVSGHGRPNTYFGTPTNLQNTLAGFKRALAGGPKFRMLIYGDSRSSDYGCGTGGTSYIDAVNRGPQAKMAARFVQHGYPVNLNSALGSRGVIASANVSAYDSRVVLTGGVIANLSFGGLLYTLDAPGETVSITLTGDTIEIPHVRLTGAGVFSYSIDGGADVNVNQGVATTVTTIGPLSVGSGSHTVTFKWVSGAAVYITGALAYDAGAPGIELINGGVGGATMANLSGTANSGVLNFVQAINPDLSIIAAGSNDTNLVTFLTNAEITMRTIKGMGKDLIFVLPGKNASGYNTIAQNMRQSLIGLCGRYGVPLIDLWSISAPFVAAEFFDTVHENEIRIGTLYTQVADEILHMVRLA